MLNNLRLRYRRSRSVNEYDLEHNKGDGHKSRLAIFAPKSSCHQVTTLTPQRRVHSEPTKRKFSGTGLQLNKSKRNSIKRKYSTDTVSSTESTRSLENEHLDFGASRSDDGFVSRHESDSIPSPGSPRRLAICMELEKHTFTENGESLLIEHENLVRRGNLQMYAYI